HVGDVEQAVDAAQIDERAVVGEVLDDAGEDGALLELLEGVLLQLLALLLEEDAAAEHDVAALLVELDDLELEFFADQLVEIADRPQIDLRTRQERLHPDVDGEAALDDLVLLQLAFPVASSLEALLEQGSEIFVFVGSGLALVVGGGTGERIRHELVLTCDSGTSPPRKCKSPRAPGIEGRRRCLFRHSAVEA